MKKLTLATFGALALLVAGCSPAQAYVKADEATLNFVEDDWAPYFRGDPLLTETQKKLRENVLLSWRKRVEAAKK